MPSQLDPATVGAAVKSLYPEYADKPDELVGSRYILKYGDSPTAYQAIGLQGQEAPVDEQRPAAEAKLVGTLQSAIPSLDRLKQASTGEDRSLADKFKFFGATTGEVGIPFTDGKTIDFTPWGKAEKSDAFNIADAILRSRSGAAAPDAEVRRFANTFTPQFFESQTTRKRKAGTAEAELFGTAKALGIDPQEIIDQAMNGGSQSTLDDVDEQLINKYKSMNANK